MTVLGAQKNRFGLQREVRVGVQTDTKRNHLEFFHLSSWIITTYYTTPHSLTHTPPPAAASSTPPTHTSTLTHLNPSCTRAAHWLTINHSGINFAKAAEIRQAVMQRCLFEGYACKSHRQTCAHPGVQNGIIVGLILH